MDRHDHAQVGVDVLELLAREPEAQVVHAGAAPLLGDADAEQLQLGHAAQEVAVEAVLAVEVVDLRLDLLRGPSSRTVSTSASVLVAQLQVDHVSSLSASLSASLRQVVRLLEQRAARPSACSAFTSTRTTENARTIGTGSWR